MQVEVGHRRGQDREVEGIGPRVPLRLAHTEPGTVVGERAPGGVSWQMTERLWVPVAPEPEHVDQGPGTQAVGT